MMLAHLKSNATPVLACALLVSSPVASRAQGLFKKSDPVEVTFTTTLKQLIRERDSLNLKPHATLMTYKDSAGKVISLPTMLRARGHFRRQARNCDFPPIKVDFEKKDIEATLFQGNRHLKLTTSCRPGNPEFEQYILAEYAVWKMYELVSPLHFRTRLAKVTYKDSAKATADVTSWAFFIEDNSEVAQKNKLGMFDIKGALFEDVDEHQLMISMLFAYMVANTDVSIAALHNIALMRDSVSQKLFPVSYDFDWSGIVNPRYASPDAKLKIKRVTDRLFRGPCKKLEEWKPVFAEFQAKRAAIDSVWASVPNLKPDRLKDAKEFLNDFWKTIADDRRARYEIVEECQKQGM